MPRFVDNKVVPRNKLVKERFPMISRAQALELLKNQGPDDYLERHSLASEAIMRALALRLGHDQESWGLCGLLHDVDFPHTKNAPERHGLMAGDLLAEAGLGAELVYAIAAHNSAYSGREPKAPLDFALRAAESITGLIFAAALMRPSGLEGMEAKSIKKKMKDKAFARAVNRDTINECEKIGIDLDEFISISIKAMSES